jgi:hypothetical protein
MEADFQGGPYDAARIRRTASKEALSSFPKANVEEDVN